MDAPTLRRDVEQLRFDEVVDGLSHEELKLAVKRTQQEAHLLEIVMRLFLSEKLDRQEQEHIDDETLPQIHHGPTHDPFSYLFTPWTWNGGGNRGRHWLDRWFPELQPGRPRQEPGSTGRANGNVQGTSAHNRTRGERVNDENSRSAQAQSSHSRRHQPTTSGTAGTTGSSGQGRTPSPALSSNTTGYDKLRALEDRYEKEVEPQIHEIFAGKASGMKAKVLNLMLEREFFSVIDTMNENNTPDFADDQFKRKKRRLAATIADLSDKLDKV